MLTLHDDHEQADPEENTLRGHTSVLTNMVRTPGAVPSARTTRSPASPFPIVLPVTARLTNT